MAEDPSTKPQLISGLEVLSKLSKKFSFCSSSHKTLYLTLTSLWTLYSSICPACSMIENLKLATIMVYYVVLKDLLLYSFQLIFSPCLEDLL